LARDEKTRAKSTAARLANGRNSQFSTISGAYDSAGGSPKHKKVMAHEKMAPPKVDL
jgi:hypothetical protein